MLYRSRYLRALGILFLPLCFVIYSEVPLVRLTAQVRWTCIRRQGVIHTICRPTRASTRAVKKARPRKHTQQPQRFLCTCDCCQLCSFFHAAQCGSTPSVVQYYACLGIFDFCVYSCVVSIVIYPMILLYLSLQSWTIYAEALSTTRSRENINCNYIALKLHMLSYSLSNAMYRHRIGWSELKYWSGFLIVQSVEYRLRGMAIVACQCGKQKFAAREKSRYEPLRIGAFCRLF